MPCSVVVGYQRLRGSCCHGTTWHHKPEGFNVSDKSKLAQKCTSSGKDST